MTIKDKVPLQTALLLLMEMSSKIVCRLVTSSVLALRRSILGILVSSLVLIRENLSLEISILGLNGLQLYCCRSVFRFFFLELLKTPRKALTRLDYQVCY